MTTDVLQNLLIATAGIIVGYITSLFLAKYNAKMALQRELKNSIAQKKAETYIKLWKLCENNISKKEEQDKRLEKLQKWYSNGGGLMLSFKAADHFFGALDILKKDFEKNNEVLKTHFTWLRTEMKYEVGSYTRKEADTYLPNTK
ncbi:hypothetical protein [Dokdonia sp.]|uniref:hypothetical protein n=1 Tax=Dokdonia sp. TaxID=2024995 RepID=UPI003265E1FE